MKTHSYDPKFKDFIEMKKDKEVIVHLKINKKIFKYNNFSVSNNKNSKRNSLFNEEMNVLFTELPYSQIIDYFPNISIVKAIINIRDAPFLLNREEIVGIKVVE
jgi:hypothetical protein